MISDKYPRKILVIAMLDSIHTARWLSQFKNARDYDIHLYNSTRNGIHRMITNSNIFTIHNGNLEEVIRDVNPGIIHTLEMQHSAYLLLPIREKSNKFPLWFYSCWGSDIKWFQTIPDDKVKIQKILNYVDAMFCEDYENIKIAQEVFHFNKPYIKVPGPGGYKVNEMIKVSDFVLPSKRKIIVVKGYTGWVYKPDTVFSALKLCAKEIIDGGYKVVVYVPGNVDTYISELIKIGIDVKRFEKTSIYDEILSLFSKSRINVAASLSDGIPNSMLEGMIMGAYPIQSAKNPSNFNDFINGEQNGILLDPLDVNGYALAIKKCLKNDILVNNAAKKNILLIKNKIEFSLVRSKVLDFFDSFYVKSEYLDTLCFLKKYYWLIFGRSFKICMNIIKKYKSSIKEKVIWFLSLIFPSYKKLCFINERSNLIDNKLNTVTDILDNMVSSKNVLEKKIQILDSKLLYVVNNVDRLLIGNNLINENFFNLNLNNELLEVSTIKTGGIKKYYSLSISSFFREMRKNIFKTNVLLDVGCGVRPEIFFEPVVHICVEPFKQYRDIIKPYFPNKSYAIFIKTDALTAIRNFDDNSVDSVFMFDLIEHLDKNDGLELIKEADRVARKQIVIFTPLGFYPMSFPEKTKDAWGLNGNAVQEHKSGWTPSDFDKTWNFYICKDCHESFLPEEKVAGKKYSAMMAIKTKKFNGFPKMKGTPEFVKNLYNERINK